MDKAHLALELDKILDSLARHVAFSASGERARELLPTSDLELARRWVAETSEARQLLEVRSDAGVGGARDVRPAAARATRGITLLPADLLDVRHTLTAARRLKRTILRGDIEFPLLGAMAQGIMECPQVVEAIDGALDDQGEVLDSASPKLARLRRDLRIVRDRIQEKLQRLLHSRSAEYLQEPIISQRGGRWVVPLQANFKGRVRGIVHDQSASGATLWIEPLNTVEMNNEFRQLLMAEEEEVQRILAELSAIVAEHQDRIAWTVEALVELDLAFAKAKYAESIKGVAPDLIPFAKAKGQVATVSSHPGSKVELTQARHPLLDPETVVPIDVHLDDETFVVIITGPNTGGKTVSLKTIGLLTLMAQSGMHLPCQDAQLSVFDSVFADIGDEQSIEQSLSTFSGHMSNIVGLLEHADDRSLVVLDELGAGTDPSEGSALARSILTYLRDKGATTFVATHYPELKLYGHNTAGVTNASVEFDLESLAPTFRLRIGLAGRSNAFSIAARLGLEPDIIDRARSLISETETTAEDLLDSIHRAREQAESEAARAVKVRQETSSLHDQIQDRLHHIDLERLRILQEARIEASQELETFREELRLLQRELSAAGKPLTEIRQLRQKVEAMAQENLAEPDPLDPLPPLDKEAAGRTLAVGDTVWVSSLQIEGQVLSVDGQEVEIQIGRLRTRAKRDELEWRRSAPRPELERGAPTRVAGGGATAHIELDLRGERVEAALRRMEKFLDSALLGNAPWVRIIHGKGTGRLRAAVRQTLKAHPRVTRFDDGKDGEGGWGVTVAHLD